MWSQFYFSEGMGEMKIDYHMHFEKGSYDPDWVEGFFTAAKQRGLSEIGISEHSHTFPEFQPLYYEDLVLDDSFIGKFQQQWLKSNKFKYTLDDYFRFMAELRKKHTVKTGIEVCNFQDQGKVKEVLAGDDFVYVIGSVHFIHGWAYDSAEIKAEWDRHSLRDIYEWYTEEIEKLAAAGLYDVLGHPFNIRLFKILPDFDVTPYLTRAVKALKKANMIVDVNTGTFYRYPIAEISPYPAFMKLAAAYDLPIITTSDAHRPEDCGAYNQDAVDYSRSFGYTATIQFDHRQRHVITLD